jgi:hypothetical protein
MAVLRSACLALLVAVMLASPAAAARGFTTGFFDGSFAAAGDGAARLDDAAASGAGIVRIAVGWPGIAPHEPADATDPADPAYQWGGLDATVAAAKVRGLQVLLSVDQAAPWAQERGRPKRYRSGTWKPRPAAVGAFATAVARRYATQVQYLQLWNEPNLAYYLSPQWRKVGGRYRQFAAPRYRAMLNAAYPGVHAAGLKLVTAGTAPYGDPNAGGLRTMPVRWWRSVLAGKVRFDVLAHHPYAIGGPRRRALNRDDVALPDMHKLTSLVRKAVRGGRVLPRSSKRYWVTEVSWDSSPPDPDGVPAARQARWLADAFYVLWKQGVDTVFWFQVRDQAPIPSYAATYQSGVYLRSGRAKPSQRAFAFPFSCERHGSGARVWARSPADGPVLIEDASGRTVKRLRAGTTRVVTGTVKRHGTFRAVSGTTSSVSCRG